MPPIQDSDSDNFMTTDEIIGICVIVVGVIICIIRLLCIKRKKRKDLDDRLELPPKKTAADHLEELKGATQRVVRSLSIHTQEPRSLLDNSILFPEEKRKSSSNNNTTRSSKSFNRKVEPRLGSPEFSRDSSKYGSSVGSLKRDSLTVKPQNRFLQVPPPSPLEFQDDIIETEPIRMSLINALLSNISKYTSSPSKTSSPVSPKSQSLIESRIQSRMGSRMSSLEIN